MLSNTETKADVLLPLWGVFLTLPQAAKALGSSRRFLEKEIKYGRLRAIKPSKMMTRISLEEWERYIDSCTTGCEAA